MNKIKTVMSFLMCLTVLSACSDIKDKTIQKETTTIIVEQTEELVTTNNDAVSSKNETTTVVATETTVVTTQQVTDNLKSDERTEIYEETIETEAVNQIFDSDLKIVAEEQFEKSCEMQWKYLMNCPFELDYEDTVEEGNNISYRVLGADFVDILADYNTVFTSSITENGESTSGDRSAETLQQKYRVSQNATYCTDSGRGRKQSYQYTYFECISYEDNILKLNAISVYINEDGQSTTKENPFTMVYIDGHWKTWEFTLPY